MSDELSWLMLAAGKRICPVSETTGTSRSLKYRVVSEVSEVKKAFYHFPRWVSHLAEFVDGDWLPGRHNEQSGVFPDLKLTLRIWAQGEAEGWRFPSGGQAKVVLACGPDGRPRSEGDRRLLAALGVRIDDAGRLTRRGSDMIECVFGEGDPFLGYQPLERWSPADDVSVAALRGL